MFITHCQDINAWCIIVVIEWNAAKPAMCKLRDGLMKKVPFFGTSARLHEVRHAVHTLETMSGVTGNVARHWTRVISRLQVLSEEFDEDLLSM